MIPVPLEDVKMLVGQDPTRRRKNLYGILENRPLLLLNKTRLGLSLIHSVVHRNPSYVITKEDGQVLPLELWKMIIAVALNNPDEDEYVVVRPRTLERDQQSSGYVSAQSLVCDVYESQESWSSLAIDDRRTLDILLDDPDCSGDDIPLHWPSRPQVTDRSVSVSLGALRNQKDQGIEFLYGLFSVEHIISWVERGECSFCHNSRNVDPDSRGSWPVEMLARRPRYWGRYVPCPICIGHNYTNDYLDLCEEEQEDYESRGSGEGFQDGLENEAQDEFGEGLKDVRKRMQVLDRKVDEWMKELGYLW